MSDQATGIRFIRKRPVFWEAKPPDFDIGISQRAGTFFWFVYQSWSQYRPEVKFRPQVAKGWARTIDNAKRDVRRSVFQLRMPTPEGERLAEELNDET